jgi:hypothetical protein
MEEIKALKELISNAKYWSLFGDVAVAFILALGILITFFWQKKKIESLKEYINLWRPSQLQKELEAYINLKDEINTSILEQYKNELAAAKDKEKEALKIIEELQDRNSKLSEKILKHQAIEYSDLLPRGTQIMPRRETDSIMWTITFRDGRIMRFKSPISEKKDENKKDKDT